MSRLSLALGSAIVIAWLLTVGFLLSNHYLSPEEIPAFDNADLFISVEAVDRWRDIEEYMLILQNGLPVGATVTTISKSLKPDRNLTYLMQFAMSVQLSPVLPIVNVKIAAGLDRTFNLTKFHGVGKIGPANLSATGEISNQLLLLRVSNSNNTNLKRIPLIRPVSLAEAVKPALGKKLEITPGSEISMPVIDPLSGRDRGTMRIKVYDKENVKVGGRNVNAYKVVSDLHDIKTTMWVDADGNTLKRQLVGSLIMERTSATVAFSKFPQLEEPVVFSDLTSSEFAGIPVIQPESAMNAASGSGIIDSLLR